MLGLLRALAYTPFSQTLISVLEHLGRARERAQAGEGVSERGEGGSERRERGRWREREGAREEREGARKEREGAREDRGDMSELTSILRERESLEE